MKSSRASLLVLGFAVFCLAPLAGEEEPDKTSPARGIHGGSLDLRGCDFAQRGNIHLDGYWDFRWMELVRPEEAAGDGPWLSYPVPATWGKGVASSGTGYASYRLRIVLPRDGARLSLLMPSVDSAYALYLNGVLAFSSGDVGVDKAHSLPRHYAPVILALPGNGGQVELLILVSCLNYPRGGLRDSIALGPSERLQREARRMEFLDLFFFGGLFVIGLSFLCLFAFRRNSRELLWFALMCLIAAAKPLITGQGLAYQLGLVEWRLGTLCEYVSNCLLICFTLLYIRSSFGRLALPRLALALAGIGFLSALFCALAPVMVYAQIIYFLFGYVAASFVYSAVVCARLASARSRFTLPFAIGLACVLAAGFNDILFAMRIYRSTNLVQAGLFVFLLCQAWIIVRRFLSLLDMEEKLATELEIGAAHGDMRPIGLQASREGIIEEKVRLSLAELRKKDALLLAQSRQASMGELIADLSHQWKQPLGALSLLFQTLDAEAEEGPIAEQSARRAIRLGMDQVAAMTATMDDYRNYFREDREKAWFALREALEATARLQSPLSERLQVEISVDCPPGLECLGFRNEFCQAMTNLIANSLDAFASLDARQEPHAKRIGIGIAMSPGWTRIVYRDNAGGIAPEALARLFEPYFTTKEKGTGIGLYICKTLIERHFGGRIAAESEAGSAIFTVSLPAGTFRAS
jgi:signal transduction histidine kinase